ncbi:MAG: hypothetical protein VXZ35_11330, partial [Pseudomonadota bacterium]|nr:hypothetical protein [Pseudomonadota bacterium]
MSAYIDKMLGEISGYRTTYTNAKDSVAGVTDYVEKTVQLWYGNWMRKALAAEQAHIAGLKATADTAVTAKTKAGDAGNISEKDTARKAAALTAWTTWKTADDFAATLTPLKDATDESKAGAAKTLKDAITELDKLTAEGTALSKANKDWATAKALYTSTLAKQNLAKAAKADYGTANTSLVATKTTDTLAQAKLN